MPSASPQATIIGSIAILLWSTLALFTTQANAVPPLLLLALTFGVASVLFFIVYLFKGELRRSWRKTPTSAMVMGGLGFFLYHFCYFYAFQHAPPVEAGLIAYLWPLLIVLMVGMSRGNSLLWTHLVGAVIAFIGTGIMLQSRSQGSQIEGTALGYTAAFACAFLWSGYSVSNRRFAHVPSSSVLWYCAITTLLAAGSHLALEPSQWSFSASTWVAIIGLGFGPVGIAFFCWDMGVKRGNLSLLGVLSYTAPALSTAWLGLFTEEVLSQGQIVACLMITAGALFASLMPTKKINRTLPTSQ
ncbi:DMT family transporter [Marinomonas pollencensis]|uniref:Drug/metabolite transporter (DMT)-like permease n=1 Tax=Marinomonas pollencensis TaxID=491954 RepID=A0A3E0DV99_9GAMM|nr:EamA family transporter [Marinomonas pollencensis]REG86454.1 drug/metabolite transporter (DMT)-like permease [Marinomonas pollencensis]